MKEIQVGDILFKVKDFLPYSELDKLNLYALFTTQIKIKQYQSLLPQIKTDETQQEYQDRLTDLITSGSTKLSNDTLSGLSNAMRETKNFEKKIDELLITSPLMQDSRPTMILKLKRTPEYVQILANVQEDLMALMDPDRTSTGKKL